MNKQATAPPTAPAVAIGASGAAPAPKIPTPKLPDPKLPAAGLLLAVLGSVAFSGKAIIVKLGYRHGVDAVTLLMLRMLFALPLFLVMAWWAGRGRPALTTRDWAGVIGLGFTGYYLSSALDFAGLVYITASLERLILCIQPTLVLLFGWMIFRRRIYRGQLMGIAVSYAGVLLVFGHEALAGQNRSAAWGAILVFLGTLSYAAYILWSGDFVKRLGALRLVGLATSVASGFTIIQYLLLRPAQEALFVAPEVIWLSLLNATLCTAIPVLAVMMAIERIGPAMASQIGMLGPICTILLGVVILDEPFTLWIAAGASLVLFGILLFGRAGR